MSVEATIINKLTAAFSPVVLQIENESHKHSSGRGGESHFKVVLVSEKFEMMRLVARHQAVYHCLSEELANGVHALALHTYNPAEWQQAGEIVPKSPSCLGIGQ